MGEIVAGGSGGGESRTAVKTDPLRKGVPVSNLSLLPQWTQQPPPRKAICLRHFVDSSQSRPPRCGAINSIQSLIFKLVRCWGINRFDAFADFSQTRSFAGQLIHSMHSLIFLHQTRSLRGNWALKIRSIRSTMYLVNEYMIGREGHQQKVYKRETQKIPGTA